MMTRMNSWRNAVSSPTMRRVMALVCASGTLFTSPPAEAAHNCSTLNATVTAQQYLPPGEVPTIVRLTVDVTYNVCSGGPAPKIRLRLFNCGGDQIAEIVEGLTPQMVCVTYNEVRVYDLAIPCGTFPKTYRMDLYWGCGTDRMWFDGTPVNVDPPEFECPSDEKLSTFLSDQTCNSCLEQEAIPDAEYLLYKSSNTLYTLPHDDQSGAAWGESVNGVVRAPTAGLLFVNVEGTSSAIDVWGGVNTGWMPRGPDAAGREGAPIAGEKCYPLDANDKFKFNLLAGRGSNPPDLEITFDWIAWIPANCCLQHDRKQIKIKTEPLPCLSEEQELSPVRPQRRVHDKCAPPGDAGGDCNDYEIRIPCCQSCGNNVCSHGNLYDWFIAWPTAEGQAIANGHGRGWSISLNGSKLIPPGPGEEPGEHED